MDNNKRRKQADLARSVRSSPELSIIFVNWHSVDYLRESLESVYVTAGGIDFEIIVVDNASSPDETSQLKAEFPDAKIMRTEKNVGFAIANNVGFQHSLGKYVLFLNPDTKVIGPAIANMLGHLKSLPGAAVVGCKLLNSDGSVQTSCIQRFPTILNQILAVEFLRLRWPRWRIWGIAPLFSEGPEPAEVEVVSGACLMIERNAFERAGMFSQQYFMYSEDLDLCYRVYQMGLKAYCVGDAHVIHYGGGSTRRHAGNQWSAIMQAKAMSKFCQTTHGHVYASVFRAAMGLAAVCRLLFIAIFLALGTFAWDEEVLHARFAKWAAILKWAVGLEKVVAGS